MRVLTAEEMRQVDQRAIDELGIPGLVLMENAAIGLADALADQFPSARSVAIVCGPGNNGGDGLALARHLEARGYRYQTFLITGRSDLRGDAAVQLQILENSGILVHRCGPEDDLAPVLAGCARADLVVDALFGTGLSRPLGGHFEELVLGLAGLTVPILAVDIPSGLEGSRPEIPGVHLHADLTVTFAAPKVAHILPPAEDTIGQLVVTDLGIPPWLVDEAPGHLHLSTATELAGCLLPRPAEAHKGSCGHVLLVAGSTGKAGAAILAARGAVRGGAGLVTTAVPETIQSIVDAGSLESMTLPLAVETDGDLAPESVEDLLRASEGKAAVALGPGLGLDPGTVDVVRSVVRQCEVSMVLDADGLNILSEHLDDLPDRSAPTILTPHPGEMARLLGMSSREVQEDRFEAARRLARRTDAVVVLKGHRTLICQPDGETHINPTGNPGMATGGSGDVLTGLLAALLGRGYDPWLAATLGVFLHGLAGDLALDELGAESLAAGDLLAALPRAFQRLEEA